LAHDQKINISLWAKMTGNFILSGGGRELGAFGNFIFAPWL